MKFNLSDFLQLDTKGLLAVNGGYNCNGSSNTTVYSNMYYSGGGSSTPNGGGSSGDNLTYTTRDNKDGTITKTGWVNGKAVIIDHLDSKTGEKVCQTQYTHGYYPLNNGNNSSTGSSGGGSCSSPSQTPSTGSNTYSGQGSNNPNGQGPSTTSSNPGGKTPHTGGTCPGTGGGTYTPPSDGGNDTGEDDGSDIPSGGGICSGTETPGDGETGGDDTPDKTSGSFGQITDGSYADELTMQYYKNHPSYMFHPDVNDDAMKGGFKFSTSGCLMTGVAKIASEKLGKEVSLFEVNKMCDKNKDGLLDYKEIEAGLKEILGDEFEVSTDYYENTLNKQEFINQSNKDDTYVLGRALLKDLNGNKEPDDYHWVVLEGYTEDANGLIFNYDGTSDNDEGRSYVYGNPDWNNNKYGINKIITITINKK